MLNGIILPKKLIKKYGCNSITAALTDLYFRVSEKWIPEKTIKYCALKTMFDKGLIQKRSPENIKRILRPFPKNKKCPWCKTKTWCLVEHHFPIPKSAGGKCPVHICPNCHHTAHVLEFTFPELIESIQALFKEDVTEYDAYKKQGEYYERPN